MLMCWFEELLIKWFLYCCYKFLMNGQRDFELVSLIELVIVVDIYCYDNGILVLFLFYFFGYSCFYVDCFKKFIDF